MKERAGLQGIERTRELHRRRDLLVLVEEGLGDESRDACDFLALLNQEVGEIVVQLDRGDRLDEERRSGAGAEGIASAGAALVTHAGRRR